VFYRIKKPDSSETQSGETSTNTHKTFSSRIKPAEEGISVPGRGLTVSSHHAFNVSFFFSSGGNKERCSSVSASLVVLGGVTGTGLEVVARAVKLGEPVRTLRH